MDRIDITKIATAARSAFEAKPRIGVSTDLGKVSLASFPHGTCGDVCLLLADIFREHGCSVRIVCGWRERASHAWLVVDNVIVDITADQFQDEGLPPVFVEPQSPWHDKWTPQDRTTQVIEDYPTEERWRSRLIEGRAELRERIDERVGRTVDALNDTLRT